ncbi:hypothetical protein [Paenibacillus sp. Soil787]|uniref:hypothetical protein n=1 Tax=Paenibacillus sp. Soil787 TaxID=1736411 RepID=UPI0006FCBB00|nr:hypothetical protein [Paenibacillus sp. Soil787]KRF43843.1 hypothetical protein ASG93_02695 [Paenibacillus sp. Soil787]
MKLISKKIIVGTAAASLVLGSGVVGLLHTTAFANTVGTLSPQMMTNQVSNNEKDKEAADNTEQQDQDQEVAEDANGQDQEVANDAEQTGKITKQEQADGEQNEQDNEMNDDQQ